MVLYVKKEEKNWKKAKKILLGLDDRYSEIID
jgi:hypothetical protein